MDEAETYVLLIYVFSRLWYSQFFNENSEMVFQRIKSSLFICYFLKPYDFKWNLLHSCIIVFYILLGKLMEYLSWFMLDLWKCSPTQLSTSFITNIEHLFFIFCALLFPEGGNRPTSKHFIKGYGTDFFTLR